MYRPLTPKEEMLRRRFMTRRFGIEFEIRPAPTPLWKFALGVAVVATALLGASLTLLLVAP